MSKHAKKLKRMADWAGTFPEIYVDDEAGQEESWLCWVFHLAPYGLRVEIPLSTDQTPWFYVDGDGDDWPLGSEKVQVRAEANYGAMTRLRLLEAHAEEIRNPATREAGLARLQEAATAAGLYGTREPHRCVKTTWTMEKEMAT